MHYNGKFLIHSGKRRVKENRFRGGRSVTVFLNKVAYRIHIMYARIAQQQIHQNAGDAYEQR